MKSNSEIKDVALNHLDGKWTDAVVMTLVYFLISSILGSSDNFITHSPDRTYFIGGILAILILPMRWSYDVIFLRLNENKIRLPRLFDGFKDYIRILGTLLLMYIYILLWSLLFFIPGIIKAFSYAMTSYILKDSPELSYNEAIEKSMEMMKGHKMKLFLLQLSFIGWAILCCLTLGIGFLWLAPYIQTSNAVFYEELKGERDGLDNVVPAEEAVSADAVNDESAETQSTAE